MSTCLRIPPNLLRRLAAGLLVVGLLAVPFGANAASSTTVEVLADSYSPTTFTVEAGATVIFQNTSAFPHTATADNGSFDTGYIASGASASVALKNAGTIAFHCEFHGAAGGVGQSGTITVTATAAATPGATTKSGGNAPAASSKPNVKPPSSDMLPDLVGGAPGIAAVALALAAIGSVAVALAVDSVRGAARRRSGR